MNITYYGHSCFGFEIAGKRLLFDPFITPNPLAQHIQLGDIKADYILLSHGHEDHMADVVTLAQQTGATVVSTFEICNWLANKGITQTQGMNIGGKWRLDTLNIKCVLAVHSNSLPDGTYGGTAMGFIIESNEGNFYYAGDTALTYDMKLIGEYRSIDFALLPIGDIYTMGVDNAIIASDFVNCDKVIGMHYNTFPPIQIDEKEAQNKFTRNGKELILMEIGSTLTL